MPLPFYALVFVFCFVVFCSDLYEHRVSNVLLSIMLVVGSVGAGWLWARGFGRPWQAVSGLLIGFSVLLPFYVIGWMGAGDVKFFAVLGLLMGAKALLPIWIIGSLLAGMHAVSVVVFRLCLRRSVSLPARVQSWANNSKVWQKVLIARQGRKGLPYAAYMAVGATAAIAVPALRRW